MLVHTECPNLHKACEVKSALPPLEQIVQEGLSGPTSSSSSTSSAAASSLSLVKTCAYAGPAAPTGTLVMAICPLVKGGTMGQETAEIYSHAKNLLPNKTPRGMPNCVLALDPAIPPTDSRCIQNYRLAPGLELIIIGHGNPTVIGTTDSNVYDCSPLALAARLIACGIPQNLAGLHILSCNSGTKSHRHFFVHHLCIALSKRGYIFPVHGYIGFTGEHKKKSRVVANQDSNKFTGADQSRVTCFGPLGQVVEQPARDIKVDHSEINLNPAVYAEYGECINRDCPVCRLNRDDVGRLLAAKEEIGDLRKEQGKARAAGKSAEAARLEEKIQRRKAKLNMIVRYAAPSELALLQEAGLIRPLAPAADTPASSIPIPAAATTTTTTTTTTSSATSISPAANPSPDVGGGSGGDQPPGGDGGQKE